MIEEFKNIGGYEYAKTEAIKIADYFKNYDNFKSKGAHLPKGILFYGQPGTGKTLFAKTIVNESKAKTFTLNTENLFQEDEITLSIKKVFDEARSNTPSIILIDELDRLVDCGGSMFTKSSDDERETLRCLLTEIDKSKDFDTIIIATSNSMLEDMPSPLVREGRIEKHVYVEMPTFEDREKIVSLYLANSDVFKNVSASNIAYYTKGLSGAALSTLVNDVLIECIRKDKIADFKDFINPIEAIKTSNIKKNVKKENIDHVIYHELGHFITNYVLNDEVGMISITPYANNSNARFSIIGDDDNNLNIDGCYTSLFNKCVVLVAGNEAVYCLLNEKYSGAGSDLIKFGNIYSSMLYNGLFEEREAVSFDILSRAQYPSSILSLDNPMVKHFNKFYGECVNKAREIINKNKELINVLFKEVKDKTYLIEDDIKEILKNNPAIK